MFPGLTVPEHWQTATKRIAAYCACVSVLFLAAVLFGFHRGLQAPNKIPVDRRIFAVPAAIHPELAASYGKLPLGFEANQGQVGGPVKFLSRGRGYTIFLTDGEAVLALRKSSGVSGQSSVGTRQNPSVAPAFRSARAGLKSGATISVDKPTTDNGPRTTGSVLRMELVGANVKATVTGGEELPGKSNYFIGNDSKKWRTNVPSYAQVEYRDVYPGIDLVYHGNQGGQLEYDFVVAPGADPGSILLAVDAAGRLSSKQEAVGSGQPKIDSDGDLVVNLGGDGDVRFHKPLVYQPSAGSSPATARPSPVPAHFVITASNRVRFAVGAYDRAQPLVIDPVLVYSTYLGGSNVDVGYGIAVDSSGSAYVTGYTPSTNFPVVNPLPATLPSAVNAFVAKLNAAGSALVYSTYLGGSSGSQNPANYWSSGIAVDSSGNAYVTGFTDSSDFPTTTGAFQTSLASTNGNAFVSKLNPTGSALVYSTYLGGNGSHSDPYYTWLTGDCGTGIAVDSSGSAYVTGYTHSTDFPTMNPLQSSLPGAVDGFVTKINAMGSALVFSTYLGGSNADYGFGVSVDSAGSAYVTGQTNSANFPTVNPFQAQLAGSVNAFLTKLSPADTALVYSTYLGGSDMDGGYGIAVDSSGSAYVTGTTYSNDFPTANPFQATLLGTTNAFVTKLNAAGSALVYSTYLGGHIFDGGSGIAVDTSGNAYVTGYTHSTDFPTANPIQASLGGTGATNAFVTKLNAAGSALVYSTYLGGSSQDGGSSIAVDTSGNAYVTGQTNSTNFPTANPIQASLGATGATNAFVAKISAPPAPGVTLSSVNLTFGSQAVGLTSSAQTVTLTSSGSSPLAITSIAIKGDFALITMGGSCPYTGGTVASAVTCTIDVAFTPTVTGPLTGSVTITDNNNGVAGSTQTISLAGTGVVAAPVAGVSPSSLTFSNQGVGTTSASQPVTLSNTGNAALTITNIGTGANFGQTNNCGSSVAASGSCTLNVTFTPTATGTITGTLSITDNSNGPTSTQSVTLSGTGQDFSFAAASGSPTSLTVAPGSTASYTLSVAGEGGFNQSVSLTCTGAPSEATCTVPNPVTAGSSATNVTVSVTTTAPSLGAPRSRPLPPVPPLSPGLRGLLMLAFALALMAWAIGRRNQPGVSRWRSTILSLASGLLLTLALAGCGGGGGSANVTHNPGTPAGTYTLTVTGSTGSGSSALSHSMTLTLTVS